MSHADVNISGGISCHHIPTELTSKIFGLPKLRNKPQASLTDSPLGSFRRTRCVLIAFALHRQRGIRRVQIDPYYCLYHLHYQINGWWGYLGSGETRLGGRIGNQHFFLQVLEPHYVIFI